MLPGSIAIMSELKGPLVDLWGILGGINGAYYHLD